MANPSVKIEIASLSEQAKEAYYESLHGLLLDAHESYQEGLNKNDNQSFREAMAKFMVIYQLDDRQKMVDDAKVKMMHIAFNLDIPWERIEKQIEPTNFFDQYQQH